MVFADELLDVYLTASESTLPTVPTVPNTSQENADIQTFFELEFERDAKEKMMSRAKAGFPSSNLLTFKFFERFYIDRTTPDHPLVVRYTDRRFTPPDGIATYRIYDVIMRDRTFLKLVDDFQRSTCGDTGKIRITKWHPTRDLNVIEAVWGK
jgi:hypothetical protein